MLLSEFQEHTPENYRLTANYSQVLNRNLCCELLCLNKKQHSQKITYSQYVVLQITYSQLYQQYVENYFFVLLLSAFYYIFQPLHMWKTFCKMCL